jgi:hypothetical protein
MVVTAVPCKSNGTKFINHQKVTFSGCNDRIMSGVYRKCLAAEEEAMHPIVKHSNLYRQA